MKNLRFKYSQIVQLRKRNKAMMDQPCGMSDRTSTSDNGEKITFPFIVIPKVQQVTF